MEKREKKEEDGSIKIIRKSIEHVIESIGKDKKKL